MLEEIPWLCLALHSTCESRLAFFFMQISLQSVGFLPRPAVAFALCINFKFPPLFVASRLALLVVSYLFGSILLWALAVTSP